MDPFSFENDASSPPILLSTHAQQPERYKNDISTMSKREAKIMHPIEVLKQRGKPNLRRLLDNRGDTNEPTRLITKINKRQNHDERSSDK